MVSSCSIAAARGEYEAGIGMIFPSLTPNITALGLEGAVATPAGLAVQGFSHVFPIAVLQWIINPRVQHHASQKGGTHNSACRHEVSQRGSKVVPGPDTTAIRTGEGRLLQRNHSVSALRPCHRAYREPGKDSLCNACSKIDLMEFRSGVIRTGGYEPGVL